LRRITASASRTWVADSKQRHVPFVQRACSRATELRTRLCPKTSFTVFRAGWARLEPSAHARNSSTIPRFADVRLRAPGSRRFAPAIAGAPKSGKGDFRTEPSRVDT